METSKIMQISETSVPTNFLTPVCKCIHPISWKRVLFIQLHEIGRATTELLDNLYFT